MLKVLLVNPPPVAVLEPWYDTPSFGRLALACLGAHLRESCAGAVEVRAVDAKLERLSFAQVVERAAAWRPDVVGLTAFTNEIKPAAYLAALIKRALPRTTTVVGGVHVTALPERTLLEFPSFDVGVVGEGERTLQELCEALNRGDDLSRVPGLVFRAQGGVVSTPERERILDQDSLPLPAWDLLPPARTYWVQSLRGCPLNCNFCMNPNGRVARKRGVANVMKELRHLVETYRPAQIRFGDEIFSVDMPRTRELVDAMAREGLGARAPWVAQTHVRYVDEDLFARMKNAGVARVEMGVETGMEDVLKTMGKGTTLPMIEAAFAAARKAGVTTGAFFLFGQPHETRASMRKTVELAVRLNPDLPMFGVMTPYPGTEVARLAANGEAGYTLLTTDWDEYNKEIGGALKFAGLSRTRIEIAQLRAYAEVFLRNGRFVDFLAFLWEYKAGAWAVVKKIFLRSPSVSRLSRRPEDYESVLGGVSATRPEDVAAARRAWELTQRRELLRAQKRP